MRHQRIALLRLQLSGLLEQRVEASVLRDEIGRALLPDAWYAGDVVARVADQRQHVRHLERLHAKLVDDARGIEPSAVFARVVDANAISHELKKILVDRNDRDLEPFR